MARKIRIHTQDEFEKMKKTGSIAAKTLQFITPHIKPGVTTNQINQLCHDFIIANHAYPAPLNYKGFPKSVCTSINNVVCHGIPDSTSLKDGDIINIDVTTILDDWYGDTSLTFLVSATDDALNPTQIDRYARQIKLMQVTKKALQIGIEHAKPGNTFGDIGYAIQTFVESQGYAVVKDFCGHGIGKIFHTEPQVLHFGKKNSGHKIVPGMFFTIEPMVNEGTEDVEICKKDKWTVTTSDGKLSAQYEHTIGITESGNIIFTL